MPRRVAARVRTAAVAAVAALALVPAAVDAHAGRPLEPHDLARAWTWDPAIVLPLALAGLLYARGVRALWREAGRRRGLRSREAAAFGVGWLVLVAALVSPLHPLGESLLSAHMVQHELLMVVASPLLVLGRPLVAFLWALPIGWRRACGAWAKAPWVRGAWRALAAPLPASLLQAVALAAWHIPGPYQATLGSDAVHAAQHVSFLATALLFWWAILRGHHAHNDQGVSVICLFATMVYTGAIGALLTFSTVLWYRAYEATAGAWGLTPLADQQLAGLIMWIPGGLVYAAAALLALGRMLSRPAAPLPLRIEA